MFRQYVQYKIIIFSFMVIVYYNNYFVAVKVMSTLSECTFHVKYITLIRLKCILMILILTQMTWMRRYETTTKLGYTQLCSFADILVMTCNFIITSSEGLQHSLQKTNCYNDIFNLQQFVYFHHALGQLSVCHQQGSYLDIYQDYFEGFFCIEI